MGVALRTSDSSLQLSQQHSWHPFITYGYGCMPCTWSSGTPEAFALSLCARRPDLGCVKLAGSCSAAASSPQPWKLGWESSARLNSSSEGYVTLWPRGEGWWILPLAERGVGGRWELACLRGERLGEGLGFGGS